MDGNTYEGKIPCSRVRRRQPQSVHYREPDLKVGRKKNAYRYHCDTTEYTEAEAEFIMAMDEFKRNKKRPFPSWSEALAVLLSLGYHR